MEQLLHITPPVAAGLAAMFGAALAWVAPFERRTLALVAHSVVAAAAAASAQGAAFLPASLLPRIQPDQVMGVVIAALCLLGATTTLRQRDGVRRQLAAAALLVFTAAVGLLAGSGEVGLATGAVLVAFVALVAPDPPMVLQDRGRARRIAVTVPHSSPRLPSPSSR